METENKGKTDPAKSGNKALWWILGGCLVLVLIGGLVIAGFFWWGYKKVKNEVKEQQSKLESQLERARSNAENLPESAAENFQEEPSGGESVGSSENSEGMSPDFRERQIGYVKRVYAKAGKNFLDIDYIQWLSGDAAEKAMREDGECPKKGECLVLDDYYIRNQNPLVRTFEISPDAKIFMQTYGAEQTGIVGNNQEITLGQFKAIFSSGTGLNSHLKDVPYIVEISNKQITKITEQYIP